MTLDEHAKLCLCHLRTRKEYDDERAANRGNRLRKEIPMEIVQRELLKRPGQQRDTDEKVPPSVPARPDLIDCKVSFSAGSSKRSCKVSVSLDNVSSQVLSNISVHLHASRQFIIHPARTFTIDFLSRKFHCYHCY